MAPPKSDEECVECLCESIHIILEVRMLLCRFVDVSQEYLGTFRLKHNYNNVVVYFHIIVNILLIVYGHDSQ